MAVVNQNEKHFLCDVLCDRFRPAHLQRKPINPLLAPRVKFGQRLFVPSQHRLEQFII